MDSELIIRASAAILVVPFIATMTYAYVTAVINGPETAPVADEFAIARQRPAIRPIGPVQAVVATKLAVFTPKGR